MDFLYKAATAFSWLLNGSGNLICIIFKSPIRKVVTMLEFLIAVLRKHKDIDTIMFDDEYVSRSCLVLVGNTSPFVGIGDGRFINLNTVREIRFLAGSSVYKFEPSHI